MVYFRVLYSFIFYLLIFIQELPPQEFVMVSEEDIKLDGSLVDLVVEAVFLLMWRGVKGSSKDNWKVCNCLSIYLSYTSFTFKYNSKTFYLWNKNTLNNQLLQVILVSKNKLITVTWQLLLENTNVYVYCYQIFLKVFILY